MTQDETAQATAKVADQFAEMAVGFADAAFEVIAHHARGERPHSDVETKFVKHGAGLIIAFLALGARGVAAQERAAASMAEVERIAKQEDAAAARAERLQD